MLQCLSAKSPPPSLPDENNHNSQSPPPQGPSTDAIPRSSGLPSPINLHEEYRLSLHTNSYNEVWTRTRVVGSDSHDQGFGIRPQESIEETRDRILSEVLDPNKESVQEALGRARPGKLTRLASAYFQDSENTIGLCLLLQENVYRARAAYAPLLDLLSVLPLEVGSLTPLQCNRAYEMFAELDSHDDPFTCSTLDGFVQMRSRFSDLKRYLENRIKRSRSRASLVKRASSGPALCLIGTAVVATVSAAAVTAHSLLAIVIAAPCAANHMITPGRFTKRALARAAQLDAAYRSTYGLDRHLETIYLIVDKVQAKIESLRGLIRLGLVRVGDLYAIQQAVKHLRSDPSDLLELLEQLEEAICLFFTTVSKAWRLLLEQICSHHSVAS
ncbi:UPF0496 protein At3g19330-like [Punica granatum]|uniref:UPF0496 protein At3g19330-like n=2 Tax=Punica granatum TaxID=22663 RepID=A0A6P8CKK0_PUNGR|nr:UPF0496 protein At3g19330-like [Punica granatum]XP_031381032.1 UPF0496 protein At3g19330-like [Punica granatum]XP_031381033.1 UPF0496 protein At3g19330-like [Punica granatum]XP_031381034.1 UPF0496 protein At3g19330-like [Punica granatum]OWM71380.1 hypothetical protein CDL15_Pgr005567 [Punica granatum]PKI52509.1 hypothetical protein CRG98_027081 [Punica granatum]